MRQKFSDTSDQNLHYWCGVNGAYEVPGAIAWLAKEAMRKCGLSLLWASYMRGKPMPASELNKVLRSPGFMVIHEWGCWRDQQGVNAAGN